MSSESAREHKDKATRKGPVVAAIVTVSDTRTPETDVNGKYLREQLEAAGHIVHSARIIRDEPALVEGVLRELAGEVVQVVLFNGGTGISRRDTTFDALDRNLEKKLPGFGENFPGLELRGDRSRGHDVAGHGWHLRWESGHFDPRVSRRGPASVGKS